MHILDVNSALGSTVEGTKGSLTQMAAHEDEHLVTKIIIVPPNVKAPKPGQRLQHRTILFALQGSATLSNGEFYQKITPGKLVVLDPGEERIFQTEKEKFVCLEVRTGGEVLPVPATTPTVAFIPKEEPVAEISPKKAPAVYDEI